MGGKALANHMHLDDEFVSSRNMLSSSNFALYVQAVKWNQSQLQQGTHANPLGPWLGVAYAPFALSSSVIRILRKLRGPTAEAVIAVTGCTAGGSSAASRE